MRIEVLTIFPGLFSGVLDYGLIHQAKKKEFWIFVFGIYGTLHPIVIARLMTNRMGAVREWFSNRNRFLQRWIK